MKSLPVFRIALINEVKPVNHSAHDVKQITLGLVRTCQNPEGPGESKVRTPAVRYMLIPNFPSNAHGMTRRVYIVHERCTKTMVTLLIFAEIGQRWVQCSWRKQDTVIIQPYGHRNTFDTSNKHLITLHGRM